MAMVRCCRLAGPALRDLLLNVEGVVFDCDGVLWYGSRAIPGAVQLVEKLKAMGKRVFFLSNNSSGTRAGYLDKLHTMGFPAELRDIYVTAHFAATYLKEQARLEGKVYLMGGDALAQELRDAGVDFVGGGPDEVKGGTEEWLALRPDPAVRAVLLGFDPHFNYTKLVRAVEYLRRPECLFLATNTDSCIPMGEGRLLPGTGSLLASVQCASQRRATVLGKPSPLMFEQIVRDCGLDCRRVIMVGDRLDTDILMGSRCGVCTVLALSGFSTLEEVEQRRSGSDPEDQLLVPDFYVDSVADFLPALSGHRCAE
uniref:glycerol-3-phosphate phosphatase-like n=1 Tax=Myxine glutinosa TaxID=7769 RepID=UPI00358EC885